MYQSVFVIAEEKNECIIATEVSFSFYCLFTVCFYKHDWSFFPFFFFFFRYNELNILAAFGFPVECLQASRDWDYLIVSCCCWKLDNWTGRQALRMDLNCENVKTRQTLGSDWWRLFFRPLVSRPVCLCVLIRGRWVNCLFHFYGLQFAMQTTPVSCLSAKRDKTTENGSFLKDV